MREEEWNEDVRELSAWSWGLYSSFWTSISKLIFSLHRIHLILLCDRRLHHRHLRHTEGRVWYRLEILIPHRSISLDLPHWTFQSHHLRRWWEEVFETFDFNSSSSLPSYLPHCFLNLLLFFFFKKKTPKPIGKLSMKVAGVLCFSDFISFTHTHYTLKPKVSEILVHTQPILPSTHLRSNHLRPLSLSNHTTGTDQKTGCGSWGCYIKPRDADHGWSRGVKSQVRSVFRFTSRSSRPCRV